MKISVVGGGPGGLYLALLTKKARPDWEIEVYERNAADDTFGFGVVFSDETLDEFLSRDRPVFDRIRGCSRIGTTSPCISKAGKSASPETDSAAPPGTCF